MQTTNDILEDQEKTSENGKGVLEERKELIEDLFEKTEEYIKTNIQLFKLKAAEQFSEIVSSLAARVVILLCGFFFFLMINFGLAYWVGTLLGQTYYGFFIVGGFYALMTWFVFLFRKNLLQTPVSNSIISKVLKVKER